MKREARTCGRRTNSRRSRLGGVDSLFHIPVCSVQVASIRELKWDQYVPMSCMTQNDSSICAWERFPLVGRHPESGSHVTLVSPR
jgi:hypothetical protein